jgi:hypothetical protein
MFIAALFTKVELWKQPTCPTTDKWIKNMCLDRHLNNKGQEYKTCHVKGRLYNMFPIAGLLIENL